MSSPSGPFSIRFAGGGSGDYLTLLSRARWRGAFAGSPRSRPLPSGILEVRDPVSIPAPGAAEALAKAAGRRPGAAIVPFESDAEAPLRWNAPPISTLRELEGTAPSETARCIELSDVPEDSAAVFFPEDDSRRVIAAEAFRILRVRRVFPARAEILAALPEKAGAILDVGCGAGHTAAEWKRGGARRRAVGIERDPALASSARKRLDDVVEGEAGAVLRGMAGGSSPRAFDTILFADTLEHLEDPDSALEAAGRLLPPGGRLVASVPNAAAAPLVEDLIRGRFDPVGAGIEDAGHLRWFTRESFCASLTVAGFEIVEIRAVPVPGGAEALIGRFGALGIACSPQALDAVQWIVVAHRR